MTIDSVRTMTVFVSDQEKARDFYVDVLGFGVKADQTFHDNRWLEVGPDAGTSLVLHKPFPGATAGLAQGTVLGSSDVDADVARLRAAGIAVEGPTDTPWGRQATFADPDGNGFVLHG
ncbi:glyoxalase superfamily protein [Phytohabitans houttuyneae]|uniref:Glyoxalase n=1 Tax=Phytohabitans houttuyneae TaxID=1076126 RepID=A0A6V8KNM8_9ACTN|nr:glyoxalase superfamily protein [Phytohabitans houttuyneae]GFJ84198.1 glyoxalase [Phytohabitans houttuyneae]